MPTKAIAAYGTQLRLGNGVSPGGAAISAASNTAPIHIIATAHGVVDVSWVIVSGVLGNVGANGSWVAERLDANTLRLRNSVGTGTYTGGGIATVRDTFTPIAELVNITPIGITFNMVDASAHDGSGWSSDVPTHKTGTDMRLELNLVPAHPTHDNVTGLIGLALGKIRRDWLVVFPDVGKSVVAFEGWVSDHGTQTPVDGLLRATPVISIDGVMIFAVNPLP